MTVDRTTRRLVEFAAGAEFAGLDAATVHEAKRRLIDAVASALGAYSHSEAKLARVIAERHAGRPDATIWGSSRTTTPEMAAFANGVMVRYLDVSDTYLGKGGGHPSDMIPALVAVAESARKDGRALINAVVLAYDVYCTLNDAVDIGTPGWDQTLYAVLGTALGAGKLLQLDEAQMAHAVSLALTPNMALRQTRQGELSGWKGCAGANAARNAVFAVHLAQAGFTGPSDVFEGAQGLWNALGRFDWPLPSPGGPQRKIRETHLKGLPICYHGQSAAWCALELHGETDAQDIEAVEVETYHGAVAMMANDPTRWTPSTRETADHSMPFVIAIALLDGSITATSFEGERWWNPEVTALMRKVKVSESGRLTALYPQAAPARVSVRLRSGKTLVREMEYPRGHARNPMDGAQLEQKFHDYFREHGDAARCSAALERLWQIEKVSDLRQEVLTLFALH